MWLEPIEQQQRVQDHYVWAAECQSPRFMRGIVRGIVELGTVELERRQRSSNTVPDSDITAEDELDDICSDDVVYFSGKPHTKRRNQFALIIEFPDIIVDPSKILTGVSNPQPLRLPNCGVDIHYSDGINTVWRPLIADIRYIDTPTGRKPTMSDRCILYKMLQNKGLVKPGKRVITAQLGRLLDESFFFEVAIKHNKFGNVKYKIFYQDAIKLSVPQAEKSSFYIGFNRENDLDALRSLESHVINTIKQSSQYPGSIIEQQITQLENAR